jgi:hypothetical protein
MSTLTATPAMAELLRQATDLTEIRDVGGNVIGFFAPLSAQQTASKGTTITTRQVFERLLSITQDQIVRSHLLKKIEGLAERDKCVSP